jgi:hypothetical protein
MSDHKPNAPCIVDLSAPAPVLERIEPDLEAAILARRADRAPADDLARGAALERKAAIDVRLQSLIAAEQARKIR